MVEQNAKCRMNIKRRVGRRVQYHQQDKLNGRAVFVKKNLCVVTYVTSGITAHRGSYKSDHFI